VPPSISTDPLFLGVPFIGLAHQIPTCRGLASQPWSVSGFQPCFVMTGSRGPDASAVMLAAVTAGVTSAAVRVPPAEILPAAVEALRRMPAAAHVEAA